MKVVHVILDKISGFGGMTNRILMGLFALLAFVNLLLHWLFPPMLDRRIGNLILVIQCSVFLGSAVALLAVIDNVPRIPHTTYATMYLCAVVLPVASYVCA